MAAARVKFLISRARVGGEIVWRWTLINRGNAVARSTRTWTSPKLAQRAAEGIAKHAANAVVEVDE